VSCPGSIRAKSFDFVEDGFCSCGPYEGAGVFVVVLDKVLDFGNQFFDAGERAASDGPLSNDADCVRRTRPWGKARELARLKS